MRYVFPAGIDAEPQLTLEQVKALDRVADRFELTHPVTVHPMLGGDKAVLVKVPRMWLGIEPDGYTHS